MNKKSMTILLIEDDEKECDIIKNYVNSIEDVKIIAQTNSSKKAIELLNYYKPDGIILDIELHKGQGSGIDFLDNAKNVMQNFKPIIAVTTNASSTVLYDKLHEDGVDIIFYKHQMDYSPKLVISSISSLYQVLYKFKNRDLNYNNDNTLANIDEKIEYKINNELDLIGISIHLKGRQYLYDAIFELIKENSKDNISSGTSVINRLSLKYKTTASSIGRVMQTAINHAWRTSSTDDLEKNYTAKINYYTGVPTPTEFMHYYANKIKKDI